MKIREVRKGMRVQLSGGVPISQARSGAGIDEAGRVTGTVLSSKAYALKRPSEEGIGVRVLWDGFRSPEFWHLSDLIMHPTEWAERLLSERAASYPSQEPSK